MADLKISELNPAAAVSGNEEIAAAEFGTNEKITTTQLRNFVLADGAGIEAAIDAELGNTDWKTGGAGNADLAVGTVDATSVEVTSSTGTNAVIPAATATDAGVQSAADKAKSDLVTVTQPVDLDAVETDVAASKAKTDNVTVTQPVDLDQVETDVAALLAATEAELVPLAETTDSVTLAVADIATEEAPTLHRMTTTQPGEVVTLPVPTAAEVGKAFNMRLASDATDTLDIQSPGANIDALDTTLPIGFTVTALVVAAGQYELIGAGQANNGTLISDRLELVDGTNKSYRIVPGLVYDIQGAGAPLLYSTFANADYTGPQYNQFQLQSDGMPLQWLRGQNRSWNIVTANYSIANTDEHLEVNTAGLAASVEITLGTPAVFGRKLLITHNDADQDVTFAEAVNGDNAYVLSGARDAVLLTYTTTGWVGIDNLGGGAAATTVKNSIEVDGGDLQLVGDAAAPGNNMFYGTDGTGNKGWVSTPGAQQVAHIFKGVNTSIPQGSNTPFTFDTAVVNVGNGFDTGVSNEFYTIQEDGLYDIKATMKWQTNSNGLRSTSIEKNLSQTIGIGRNAAVGFETYNSASALEVLAAGDTIRLVVFQDSGAALDAQSEGDWATTLKITKIA